MSAKKADPLKNHVLVAFGQAVLGRRNELGISQEELAARAGLHRTYIGDIERGTRNVALLNITSLAVALEWLPETLLKHATPAKNRHPRS